MINRTQALAIAVTVLLALTTSMVTAQEVVPGLTVTSSSPAGFSYTLTPVYRSIDTVMTENGPALHPSIAGARLRQAADGSVQWVVGFDVIVPHAQGFAYQAHMPEITLNDLPLRTATTPEGSLIPTPEPRAATGIVYTGVVRGRHIARVEAIVAKQTHDGTTVLFTTVRGEVVFAPARVYTDRLQDAAHLDFVVNPDAPWVAETSAATRLVKGEQVQVGESYENVFRIPIDREGVYRLTAQQLRDAGVPTDAAAARTLKIFGRGGTELSETVEPPTNDVMAEQAIIVRTNGSGEIAEVLFYASGPSGFRWGDDEAEHYIHHYDTESGYLLTYGGDDGRRAEAREAAAGSADQRPLTVTGYVFQEEERVNPYSSGSGRKWFGQFVENGGSLVMTTDLPGLVRNGTVQYRMNLAHRGSVTGVFTVYENGQAISQRSVSAVPQYMDTYSVRASGAIGADQIASDGRSVLRFSYQCSDATSSGLLDWFEIHYPRGLVARDREFAFFGSPQTPGIVEYTVNGLEGGSSFGFDVTDRSNPILIQNVAPSGGLFTVREQFDSGAVRRYFLSSNIRSAQLSRISPLSLRSRAVSGELGDYLVITHPSLVPSAERYADYRTQNSELRVSVITTDEIYREFSYGVQDPTAIRDLIGFAYRHGGVRPRYVMLWGDGHYDYKGISTSTPNWVPPYESLDPDDRDWGLYTYTTDDFFVRVEGNDTRPDLAIGRLPITSNAVGDRLIEKIRRYEHEAATDDWRTRVALIADDGETSGGASDGALHLKQSETLVSSYVPAPFQAKKIYMVEYPTENIARGRRKPSVTGEYVSTINTTGALLLNWIGHGNPRVWAHETIFERETTPPQFANIDKPFFLTAATCDFARFDLTGVQSGAEELVLLEQGGAIGVFSAARVVFSFANAEINQEFYQTLFTPEENGRTARLGDVIWKVKQKFYGDNDEKFFLLGDPTMRLLIPDHDVIFETVNGQSVTDGTVQVEALSTVTVTGYIAQPGASGVDDSFNGIATISLQDAQRRVTVIDDDRFNTVNNFTLPGAALSRGSYAVEAGRFEATFVVPKDIAFSSETARLYGYAYSDDDRTAMGVTDKVVVDGVVDASFDDEDGPEIQLYLDSRYFLSGQIVREHPILIVDLQDETGINTTGVGVGHGIEAMFNGGDRIDDLTESFSTSLESSRAGTATKQIFDLGEGHHTVRVRAWDVLNNMSEVTTSFRIASADQGVVASWLTNYPNPFSTSTTIRFQHNVASAFTARLQIFDTQGNRVVDRPMDVRDMQTAEIAWDGRDDQGNQLGTGVYIAVVRATDVTGATSDVRGKLALIR